MKIALAQLNYHIGNFDNNFSIMKDAVISAKAQNADLICFSELATCGYPPRDFLEFKDFIKQSIQVVNQLCELSDGIGIVVGLSLIHISEPTRPY